MKKNKKPRIWAMKHNAKLTDKDPNARVYFEQLDAILDSENLLNIAITGNRGSGKSSILHSYDNYKHKGMGERFLYISLAEFEHYVEEAAKKSEEQSEPDADEKNTGGSKAGEAAAGSTETQKESDPDVDKVVLESIETPAEGRTEKKQPDPGAANVVVEETGASEEGRGEQTEAAKKPNSTIEKISIDKPVKPQGKAREEIQKKLEYSMLSQILTKCTRGDLRNSSLKAIPEVREARRGVFWVYGYAFLLFMLICGLKYEAHFAKFFQRDFLETLFPKMMDLLEKVFPQLMQLLENNQLAGHGLGYVLACGMVFVGAAYLIQQKPGLFRLGKVALKLPGVEAETSPSENVFCLDHYRFELIHILNQLAPKIGYTVVIEDLELVGECCAEEIMSKLRELNMQVNTHRQTQYNAGSNLVAKAAQWIKKTAQWIKKTARWIKKRLLQREDKADEETGENVDKFEKWFKLSIWKGKKCAIPVRFVYAISDATFDEEERTKFFDTILPVTPALNHKNAFEIIKNEFTGEADIAQMEGKRMMREISKVITDYRQLNDVKTEYAFFYKWYLANDPLGYNRKEQNATEEQDKKGWPVIKSVREWFETRKRKRENDKANGGKGDSAEQTEDYEIKRKLLAIAVYKALLPLEYHYAFTRKGGGILINPRTKQIEGKEYDEKVVILIDFLFRKGYLDAESLVLIGYSRELLRQQWEDILIHGTDEERRDLLNRFDPDNDQIWVDENGKKIPMEELRLEGQKEMESKSKVDPYLDQKIRSIQEGARNAFGSAEAMLKIYYSIVCDDQTNESLANLLICLSAFPGDDLQRAFEKVNSTANLKKKYQKELNFKEILEAKLKDALREYKNNENLRKKYKHAVPVIALLLGKTAKEVEKEYSLVQEKKK